MTGEFTSRRAFLFATGSIAAGVLTARFAGSEDENTQQLVAPMFSDLETTTFFDDEVDVVTPVEIPASSPLAKTGFDNEIGLANSTVFRLVEIEGHTRIPWFVLAALTHKESEIAGIDKANLMPQNIDLSVSSTAEATRTLVFPENYRDAMSLRTALRTVLANHQKPYSETEILQNALNIKSRFDDAKRSPISTGQLPNGLVDVQGIRVHPIIAQSVAAILNSAQERGYTLSGYGARTTNKQTELRYINGCGHKTNVDDMFSERARNCNVPTAPPGLSRHEQGLAVDFTVQGSDGKFRTVQPGTVVARWLKKNATQHGLINLASEAWHYSIDGR